MIIRITANKLNSVNNNLFVAIMTNIINAAQEIDQPRFRCGNSVTDLIKIDEEKSSEYHKPS